MAKFRQSEVRRGDGSIRERPRRGGGTSYQARWHDGIKWRSRTFHGSIEQAEDFLRQRGRDMRTGRYVADEDVTLLNAIDDYLRRGKKKDWEANTRATYGSVRNMLAKYPLVNTRLSDITPRQCQHLIDDLVDLYSPHRMIVIRAVLNGTLREAALLGVINANPMTGVRMPAPKRREYVVWDTAQSQQALQLSTGQLHAYYTVALTTGMRPGELRALMWQNIDFDSGVITIESTMTRDENYSPVRGTSTKGDRTRTVLVPTAVMDTLRGHKVKQNARQLRADLWHDGGYVFERGDGRYLPQQNIARLHKRFCEHYGLPVCRLHDLRHAAASILFHAGVDIKVISETLGHQSVRTTQEVYAHVGESQKREVADHMNDALGLKRKA